jgi:L-rhamnose isomerase
MGRVHIALDYFDATLNRVGAWVIGARATQKALLAALLQPWNELRSSEASGRYFERLAWMEEAKTFPLGDVWDYYCLKSGAPLAKGWIADIRAYEVEALSLR